MGVKFSLNKPDSGSRESISEYFEKVGIRYMTYQEFMLESLNNGYEIIPFQKAY